MVAGRCFCEPAQVVLGGDMPANASTTVAAPAKPNVLTVNTPSMHFGKL